MTSVCGGVQWWRQGAAAGSDDVGMRRMPPDGESGGSGSAFSPVPAVRPARARPSPPLPSAPRGCDALVSSWGWPFCRGCLQTVAWTAEVLRAGPAVGAMAAGKHPAVLGSRSPRKAWRLPADGHPAPGCYLRWATRSCRQQRRWLCRPAVLFACRGILGAGAGSGWGWLCNTWKRGSSTGFSGLTAALNFSIRFAYWVQQTPWGTWSFYS